MIRHENGIRLVSPTTTQPLLNTENQKVMPALNRVKTILVDHIAQSSTTLREDFFDFRPTEQSFSLPQGPRTRMPNPSSILENNLYSSYSTSPPHRVLLPRSCSVSRRSRHFVPNERKDEYYWQKRRKNNEAARKSREKRRTIDNVLEEKVLILSHENEVLRQELYLLKVKYGEIEPESSDQFQPKKNLETCHSLLIDAKHDSAQDLLAKQDLGLSKLTQLIDPSSTKLCLLTQELQHPLDFETSKNTKSQASSNIPIYSNVVSNSLQGCHRAMNDNRGMEGEMEEINSDEFGVSFLSKIARGDFYLAPVDLSQKCARKVPAAPKNDDADTNLKESLPIYEAANALVNLREGPHEESQHPPLNLKLSNDSGDNIARLPHKLRFKQSKSL